MADWWEFVERQWPLIVADFRREYQLGAGELAALASREFQWLLRGLSDRSRFRRAWNAAPKHLYEQSDIEAVKAAARR